MQKTNGSTFTDRRHKGGLNNACAQQHWSAEMKGREGEEGAIGNWPRSGAEANFLNPPTNLQSPWKLQLLRFPVSKGPYWTPSLGETPHRFLRAAPEGPRWGKVEPLVPTRGALGWRGALKGTASDTPVTPALPTLSISMLTATSWASDSLGRLWLRLTVSNNWTNKEIFKN